MSGWGHRWSADEDATLTRMRQQGISPVVIASRLGRSESSVHSRIETLALRPSRIERKCMCCRGTFLSDGPHNRMCTNCRGKSKTQFDF